MYTDSKKLEWEDSYANRDNFVFYPHEEVIRFISKYVRKRVGLNEYADILTNINCRRVIDLGCGIGRHVMYSHDMGLEAYGVDLSESAINFASGWAGSRGYKELASRFYATDARRLPYADSFFDIALSHGVLDSMPFEIAREICIEMARVMASKGLFYCDLVSGDDSQHSREFSGMEVVNQSHEKGTIQFYFNMATIKSLFDNLFEIIECNLIRREDVLRGGYIARYHLVLRKI